MAQKTHLAVNPDIVCREEGDEALLFDPETERVKVLNATGLMLWNLCDGSHSQDDLVQALVTKYPDVGVDTLKADVKRFLTDMLDMELLESIPGK
jgi:hypothetical protein